MAIYDYDGSKNREIGKVYDYDGTKSRQIARVYDYNNSVNTLIYTDELVMLSASPVVYLGSWEGATAEYPAEGRFLMQDYAKSHTARNNTLIDFSQFDTFTAQRTSSLYKGSTWEGTGSSVPTLNAIRLVDESGNILIEQAANNAGTVTHTFNITDIKTTGYVEVVGHSFTDNYVTYWSEMKFE